MKIFSAVYSDITACLRIFYRAKYCFYLLWLKIYIIVWNKNCRWGADKYMLGILDQKLFSWKSTGHFYASFVPGYYLHWMPLIIQAGPMHRPIPLDMIGQKTPPLHYFSQLPSMDLRILQDIKPYRLFLFISSVWFLYSGPSPVKQHPDFTKKWSRSQALVSPSMRSWWLPLYII